MRWTTKWAKPNKFEVAYYLEKFVVNIQEKDYNRRFWGLIGMPCKHVYACIFFIGAKPLNYITNYYLVEGYKTCYNPIVNLVNGENLQF